MGQQLGAEWERQTFTIPLTGNLASAEARGIVLSVTVGAFNPVSLAFAWARTNAVPVILGQVNFFVEFDVCFHRARNILTIKPRDKEADQ